jgi:hypothetical protein
VIRSCTIDGGQGGSFSAAIYNRDGASPLIEGNVIRGGDGNFTFGIYNFDNCSPRIQGNRINASGAGTQSLAIYNDLLSPAVIRNNLIDGGGGAYSVGIMNFESSPVLRNNTISGGRSGGDWTVAVFNQTAQPVIQNNVIMTVDGSGRIGVFEYDADADPQALQNNDIYNCPSGLYYDADGSGYLFSAAEINNYTLTTQDAGALSDSNTDVDAILADPDGPDDDQATLQDNDWRLSSGSPATVTSGGLNGAHSNAGWGFNTDFNGWSRSPLDDSNTTGWSMGAYEYGALPSRALLSSTAVPRVTVPERSGPTSSTPATPPPLPTSLRSSH